MTPRAIELFCGCGGMSTGLLDAGIQVLAGFDHDQPSVTTFNYNHQYRGALGHVLDLASASGEDIRRISGWRGHFDLIAAGPPCQPFSIAGKRKALDDSRGNLIFKFVDFMSDLMPSAFIFENVPNLGSINGGTLLARLKGELSRLGYTISVRVLNAAEHGVPQSRKRLFVVGTPAGVHFEFPSPTHGEAGDLFDEIKPFVTASDVLADLPDVNDVAAHLVPNHEPTMHSAAMLEAFRNLRPGTREKKSYHDRLHANRVGYTLRAGSGNFSPLRPVHYKYDRVISVRESARLQGMSDDFVWPDPLPRLQQYRQVGNAVPPPLAAAVASRLAKVMGWDADATVTRGDPSSRPPAFFISVEERHRARVERLRGASLGRLRQEGSSPATFAS